MSNRRPSGRLTVLIGVAVVIFAIFIPVTAFMIGKNESSPSGINAPTPPPENSIANMAPPGSQAPDVFQMTGPISQDRDLRDLPYRAPTKKGEMPELFRYPK